MRILVTGGAGYVGLPLCRQLAGSGHDLTVLDSLATTAQREQELTALARLTRIDITDRAACVAAIQRANPEIVVHLAALHFIPECNRRPADAIRINVVGTQNVLDACLSLKGLSRVLVTSSAAVYPVSDRFMRETDAPDPSDVYGATKAVNEWQARQFAIASSVPTIAIRLYNVFGPGETNPHVIPEIIAQLQTGDRTLKLGNVLPKRCYLYVDDVVAGFQQLSMHRDSELFRVINLGRREEASVADVIAMISSLLGVELEIDVDPQRWRPSDRPFLRCDPGLMEALTGWQPRFSTEDGLRQLLRAERLL